MYAVLSIAAAAVALVVAGFGVFAIYILLYSGQRETFRGALKRWTVFDYVIFSLFLIGSLFLLADLAGVLRDRDAYPFYHYGYLLSGFIYNLLAGVFLFVRLGLTLRMAGGEPAASDGPPLSSDDEGEPQQAKTAEKRV